MKKAEEYYPPEIMDLAKDTATDMVAKGESLREVKFGHEAGVFYVSDDPDKIVSINTLEVEGRVFHVGLYQK